MAPLLLVGLGVSGYLFSMRAVAPVEETLRILRRFMADAGHELSTPISIIQVNAEAMEQELSEQSLPQTRVEVITRSTEHMSNLVQDLMLLSRMESPQLVSHTVSIELDKVVHATIEEFNELSSEKGITLTDGVIQPTLVSGDPNSLKRMLSNLLSNALRYTDKDGIVTVSLSNSVRQAKLSVVDTGIGIPEESLDHIFERFYRVEKSRSRA